LLLLWPTLACADELADAERACERDVKACARVDELKAAAKSDADRAYEAERLRAEAELRQRYAEQDAREKAEAEQEAALRTKCGADYMRVRVGMKWPRVQECSGPFDVKGQDERGTIYESAGGFVRVERGRVTRWIAK
jgi:hypothetical protein